MSVKITIQGRGIHFAASVRDGALFEIISFVQNNLDESSPLDLGPVAPVAGVGDTGSDQMVTQNSYRPDVAVTMEDRVKTELGNYAAGELLNRVGWSSFSEKILLLACWAEAKGKAIPWKRDDIESVFAQAKERPPANFGRDVGSAIKSGWIHAQTARTYIVTRSGWNRVGEAMQL